MGCLIWTIFRGGDVGWDGMVMSMARWVRYDFP